MDFQTNCPQNATTTTAPQYAAKSFPKSLPVPNATRSVSPSNHGGTSLLSSTGAAATFVLVLLAAARRHGAGATDYTVGDSAGWTNGPNYLSWSQKYNFTAGDTLVFNYVAAQHNVYRVTQDAFQTCEGPAANQTMGSWATGRDRVDLPVPGDYYFVCNVAGHCLGGMKFAVAVAAPPPPPPASPPPPALALPLPPPPASSAAVSWTARRRPAWPELVQRRIPCLAVIGLLVLA